MKRTELKRGKGLRRVAMSPRRTPLKRGNSRLGLRRPPVTAGELAARVAVRRRSGGWCEAVVSPTVCLGEAANFHHRKDRSLGGEWSKDNGLDVCGSGSMGCHGWITAHPAGARAKGWSVPSWADPATVSVSYRGVDLLLRDLPDVPIGGAR